MRHGHWKLRTLYALYMMLPAAFMARHIQGLSEDTALGLVRLFLRA